MKKGKLIACMIVCAVCTAACGESREEEFVEYSVSVEKIEETKETTVNAASNEEEEAAEDQGVSFYGTWEVKDHQTAEVSALSEEEISAFLDDTVTYQKNEVLLNGQKMNAVDISYEFAPYTEQTLAEEYRANLGEWWNGKPEVSRCTVMSSESFFGDHFFIADEETIWICYEGVFFLAKRVDA